VIEIEYTVKDQHRKARKEIARRKLAEPLHHPYLTRWQTLRRLTAATLPPPGDSEFQRIPGTTTSCFFVREIYVTRSRAT
jgi:hypothetical protein